MHQQKQKTSKEPSKNPKTDKSSRKEKLASFYSFLLKLNMVREIQNISQSDVIVDAIETDQLLSLIHTRRKSEAVEAVPLRFASEQHYVELWQSLFYEQAKAQIYRAKAEEGKTAEPVEVLEVEDIKVQKQKLIKLKGKSVSSLPGTIVILSPENPTGKKDYPHLLGLIEAGEGLVVRAMLDEQFIEEMYPGGWQLMIRTKKWYLEEICMISTLEREYLALISMNDRLAPILKEPILHPEQYMKNVDKKFKIPNQLDQKLKNSFNDSQYKAITQCLKQTGITLIQGPPGTGKTKTVLGTLSVLLSSFNKKDEDQQEPLILNWKKSAEIERKNSHLSNPWNYTRYVDWRDEPLINSEEDPLNLSRFYEKCENTDKKIILTKKEEELVLPGKVLICGPSNASVDEIIRKMISEQLLDSQGSKYMPNLVRVGQNYDPSLKEYSLDFLAQKMCKTDSAMDPSQARIKILNEFRLIFATLSAAGSPSMQNANVIFDTVVIDEAGQSIEISNLIPLMYGCQRLILIGDPNQLPATVFSQKSLEHKYEQSLFERLMKSGYPISVLKTQYRMHPEISAVIGRNFYGQNLLDSETIINTEPSLVPKSFIILHLDNSAESSYKKSFRNMTEAHAVIDFVNYLSKSYNDIGVISPYSQQIALLNSLGLGKNKKTEVKTIDSFQGREKDVIVFSAVRSRFVYRNKQNQENKRKTIGFVGDMRRINVSLSRSKTLCVIFGDVKRLSINETWRNIILKAINEGQVYEFQNNKNFLQQFKSQPKKFMMKSLE